MCLRSASKIYVVSFTHKMCIRSASVVCMWACEYARDLNQDLIYHQHLSWDLLEMCLRSASHGIVCMCTMTHVMTDVSMWDNMSASSSKWRVTQQVSPSQYEISFIFEWMEYCKPSPLIHLLDDILTSSSPQDIMSISSSFNIRHPIKRVRWIDLSPSEDEMSFGFECMESCRHLIITCWMWYHHTISGTVYLMSQRTYMIWVIRPLIPTPSCEEWCSNYLPRNTILYSSKLVEYCKEAPALHNMSGSCYAVSWYINLSNILFVQIDYRPPHEVG